MNCPKCGKRMAKDARYCSYCGSRFHTNGEEEYLALNRRKNNWIGEKERERKGNLYGRYAAVASWTLAIHLYDEVARFRGGKSL